MSNSPTFVVRSDSSLKQVCPSCNLPRNIDNFKGTVCIWCDQEEKKVERNPSHKLAKSLVKRQLKRCQSCGRELVNSSRNFATLDSIYCNICDRHERACQVSDKFHPAIVSQNQ